ncbi:MAG: tRNA guanosine(15) transglycosylase TgtA [Candidatus Bathyarchaeota archaeon]|nr:MAG: tRNA guanosine(15) transglycosylase TgtA [Candidatus Bathyarchaeota archaeon]
MTFEVRHRDMLARLGKISTKSGTIETPALLPVINPVIQPISIETMRQEYSCDALITNAYILMKRKATELREGGVHRFLDFDRVIMTDSGAYQILIYGKVDVSPEEIVQFQEQMASDIATILDIPTGWRSSKKQAKITVDETIKRAKQAMQIITRKDILWVGPIQGGQHLDLVAYAAKEVGKLPFAIHALGSPTPIMENYLFDKLVDMIMSAKMNMPQHRPLHLFGAGHPFMFALAVALGCDMFDSAAYAIFARQNRYMTEYGSRRLDELEYFPCSCSVCRKNTPKEVRLLPSQERQEILAKHNLSASFAELKRIKQAIIEGRLWEFLELRAHSHPALLQATKRLKEYEAYLENFSPTTKNSGLFFFSHLGLVRPEITRHRKRLSERYSPPRNAEILILLPSPSKRPFHQAKEVIGLMERIQKKFGKKQELFHICIYAAPFGVTPLELDEIYPLSQHEIALPLDLESKKYVASQVKGYIETFSYKRVILIEDPKVWKDTISIACKSIKKPNFPITVFPIKETFDKAAQNDIIGILQTSLI